LLAEWARGDDPQPPVHALEVEHVCARQLPHLLLLPVLRQADAALLHSCIVSSKLINQVSCHDASQLGLAGKEVLIIGIIQKNNVSTTCYL
jgi:hypothetical protein